MNRIRRSETGGRGLPLAKRSSPRSSSPKVLVFEICPSVPVDVLTLSGILRS